jgi:hypothetical protein
MDHITNVRIVKSFNGTWGVQFDFKSGLEIVEYVGSIDKAIDAAAKMRTPPVLHVIQGGLA